MNNAQIIIAFISSIVFIPFVVELMLQKLEQNAKLAGKKEARLELEKMQEINFKELLKKETPVAGTTDAKNLLKIDGITIN